MYDSFAGLFTISLCHENKTGTSTKKRSRKKGVPQGRIDSGAKIPDTVTDTGPGEQR